MRSASRTARRVLRGAVGVLTLLLLGACSSASPTPQQAATAAAASGAALRPSDVVGLTVYFRQGTGDGAHLVPVTRDVPVGGDLPRRALELLLAGPEPDDGSGLAAPLPTSSAVLGFAVEDAVAHVDLSAEVIADRTSVGASAPHELLGLAALANTLTEFPEVEQVALTVEGRRQGPVDGLAGADVGAFWGWWGLPDRLRRDETLVGASPDGAGLLDVAMFRGEEQAVGTGGATARVAAVRTRSRATTQRVTVELADPSGDGESVAVPATTARRTPDGVLVEIAGVTDLDADVALGTRELDDSRYPRLTVDGQVPGTLRLLVEASEPGDFWLHTLTAPTRVVVDLRA